MRKGQTILALTGFLMLLPAICMGVDKTTRNKEIIRRNYDIFTSLVNTIDANYVDTLPLQKMFDKAINGFLSPLDPYTVFFNEKDAKEFMQSSKGEFGGIGIFLTQKNDDVVITGPIEGSPAFDAGLRTGDIILAIDSVSAKGLSVDEARNRMMGMPGTNLNLRVRRPYTESDSILDFTLLRTRLTIPTINYYGVDDDGIGYFDLTQFGENSAEEVKYALERILSEKNLKGLVIDLTGNGGGLLEAAEGILELLLPKGSPLFSVKGGDKVKEYVSKAPAIVPSDLPVAVLIDGGTASASELTAGALQDLDRAVLVGTRSYGKGLVQSTMPTPYNTMVKVTTSKYYIPSGRLIQAYDYSRRNPDGSVAHIPDSLAHPYKTAAGRTVYDGGGLSPDTVVEYPDVSPIVMALGDKDIFFDYANKYYATHETISSPKDFRISDEIFSDFKNFINPETFVYTSESDNLLKILREKIKEEGYLKNSTEEALESLEKSLAHNMEDELDSSRDIIDMVLSAEIINRYYNKRGEAITLLNYNPLYLTAKKILLDKTLYNKMLSSPEKEKTSSKKK